MSELLAEFTVLGVAKPAGSKKAFKHPHSDRIIVTDDTGAAGRAWRTDVQVAAAAHFNEPYAGAVDMDILFQRPRPKGHYGSGRNASVLKPNAPTFPTTRPDVDKLSRAVLDALKGIAWNDDAQVVTKTVAKRFGPRNLTVVRIYRAELTAPAEDPVPQFALDSCVILSVDGNRDRDETFASCAG